jgi:hypothetical protein
MLRIRSVRPVLPSILAGLLIGCGGDGAKEEAAPDPAVETTSDAVPASAPAANPSDTPVGVADIDRWAKGMAGELEAVQAAAGKLKSAKTGKDSIAAIMGVQESNTLEAGASAAGLDPERYRLVKSNLSAAAAYLAPEVGGIDTTMLSPEQRAEIRKTNETRLTEMQGSVPSDVVAALKPRAAELRKQDLELVGARLKGAGM